MSYIKQDFVDGQTLFAEQMNHIEQGIIDNEEKQAEADTDIGLLTQDVNEIKGNLPEIEAKANEAIAKADAVKHDIDNIPTSKVDVNSVNYNVGQNAATGNTVSVQRLDDSGTVEVRVYRGSQYETTLIEDSTERFFEFYEGVTRIRVNGYATVEYRATLYTTLSQKLEKQQKTIDNLDGSIIDANERINEAKDDITDLDEKIDNVWEEASKNLEEVQDNLTASINQVAQSKLDKPYVNFESSPITDSDEGTIKDLICKGKAEQETTQGYQLLDLNKWNPTIAKGTGVYENNGVTLTATENDCYTNYLSVNADKCKIPIAEGETITISWKADINVDGRIYIFPNGSPTGNVSANNAITKKLSYTATTGVNYITFRFGVSEVGNTIKYSDIMIEQGTVAHEWEPYTGGIPSPNPEFTKPVTGVTEINWKQCGKNLWKPIIGGYLSNIDGTVSPNEESFMMATDFFKRNGEDISITSSWKSDIVRAFAFRLGLYDENKVWIKNITLQSDSYTFVVSDTSQAKYLRLSAPSALYNTLQIEYGQPTPYEPYVEQVEQFIPPRPLYKIGDYADKLDVEKGVWEYAISQELYNGSEAWTPSTVGTNYRQFTLQVAHLLTTEIGLCNWLSGINTSERDIKSGFVKFKDGSIQGVRISLLNSVGVLDVNEYKQYLSNHNLKALFPLVTPTTIPINADDLAKLKALTTYKGVTNISITDQNGNDISSMFKYPQNLEAFVEEHGGGGSSIHVYSTEEKVVGKWIDGRDVWEKTFELTGGMTSTYNNIDLISTGISQYIDHNVTFHLSDGRNSSNYLPPTDASYGTYCSIFVGNGKMSTEIYKGSNKYINKAEITVRYVKTT